MVLHKKTRLIYTEYKNTFYFLFISKYCNYILIYSIQPTTQCVSHVHAKDTHTKDAHAHTLNFAHFNYSFYRNKSLCQKLTMFNSTKRFKGLVFFHHRYCITLAMTELILFNLVCPFWFLQFIIVDKVDTM